MKSAFLLKKKKPSEIQKRPTFDFTIGFLRSTHDGVESNVQIKRRLFA